MELHSVRNPRPVRDDGVPLLETFGLDGMYTQVVTEPFKLSSEELPALQYFDDEGQVIREEERKQEFHVTWVESISEDAVMTSATSAIREAGKLALASPRLIADSMRIRGVELESLPKSSITFQKGWQQQLFQLNRCHPLNASIAVVLHMIAIIFCFSTSLHLSTAFVVTLLCSLLALLLYIAVIMFLHISLQTLNIDAKNVLSRFSTELECTYKPNPGDIPGPGGFFICYFYSVEKRMRTDTKGTYTWQILEGSTKYGVQVMHCRNHKRIEQRIYNGLRALLGLVTLMLLTVLIVGPLGCHVSDCSTALCGMTVSTNTPMTGHSTICQFTSNCDVCMGPTCPTIKLGPVLPSHLICNQYAPPPGNFSLWVEAAVGNPSTDVLVDGSPALLMPHTKRLAGDGRNLFIQTQVQVKQGEPSKPHTITISSGGGNATTFYLDLDASANPCVSSTSCVQCNAHPECSWCENDDQFQSHACLHNPAPDLKCMEVCPSHCKEAHSCEECLAAAHSNDKGCGWCGVPTSGASFCEFGDAFGPHDMDGDTCSAPGWMASACPSGCCSTVNVSTSNSSKMPHLWGLYTRAPGESHTGRPVYVRQGQPELMLYYHWQGGYQGWCVAHSHSNATQCMMQAIVDSSRPVCADLAGTRWNVCLDYEHGQCKGERAVEEMEVAVVCHHESNKTAHP